MSGAVLGEQVLRIAPDQIAVPERIGFYFEDKAVALGRLMAVDGQRTPITVRKSGPRGEQPWTLVVGMHRLSGARLEGLPHVLAIEVTGANAAEIADMEASENVHRRVQPPLEQAKFIAAVCDSARARLSEDHGGRSQQEMAVRSRWARVKAGEILAEKALQEEGDDTRANLERVYGWEDTARDAFGLSRSDIYRALRLYRLIIEPFPGPARALSDHPVVGDNASQLRLVADVRDQGLRGKVIHALLANPELSADEARVLAGVDAGNVTPLLHPHQKFYDQITGGWSRLAVDQKRAFVPELVKMLGTDSLKRALRDRLNEDLGENARSAEPNPYEPGTIAYKLHAGHDL